MTQPERTDLTALLSLALALLAQRADDGVVQRDRRGRLSVRRALQRQRGRGLVFVGPKIDTSRRTVPLPAGTVLRLADHRRRQ